MRFWKPCAWGFFGPGKPNFPVEAGPASRHRAPLPSLVSLGATPRGREVERRTPPPPGSPPGVPAAISSFASGDSPLPVPLHLLAPMLGFLLSSPHTFSCRSCKKSRSREPTAAVRDPTSSSGATSSVRTHSSASPPARTCTWAPSRIPVRRHAAPPFTGRTRCRVGVCSPILCYHWVYDSQMMN